MQLSPNPLNLKVDQEWPAEKGLAALVEEVDSLITIPNQKLMEILGGNIPIQDAFGQADDVLKGAVQGISDIIMKWSH